MATAARARANAFATELFNRELRPESLATLAIESNLTVRVSAPFDLETGPKDLDAGPSFAKSAFSLSPTNEPFAGPLAGEDAIYVIAYNKRIASEVPTLDQVRERVVADYKYAQALNQARQAGQAFYQTLTNGLAQGKAFSALCAEAKFKPLEVPPFSLSTRSLQEVQLPPVCCWRNFARAVERVSSPALLIFIEWRWAENEASLAAQEGYSSSRSKD